MKYKAFIINLEHATTRWAHMSAQLDHLGIPYTRVEGIFGDTLSVPIKGYNETAFRLLTGKETNKREVGCYFSHIKALATFLESDLPYALVLEDDVTFPENIIPLLSESITYGSHWDMLRLTSSRQGYFLPFAQLSAGYELAYNLRVLKNAGAYLINRHAARCCVEKMLPMRLPYDVAQDRDWDYGFKTACITPFPIVIEDFPSQIGHKDKTKRIPLYRSTTFHLFHLRTLIERRFYRWRYYRQAIALNAYQSCCRDSDNR